MEAVQVDIIVNQVLSEWIFVSIEEKFVLETFRVKPLSAFQSEKC